MDSSRIPLHQDIQNGVKEAKIVEGSCDDTAFWTIPSTIGNIKYKYLQKELNRFSDWTKFWNMSLNPDKCSTINLHKTHHKIPHNNNKYIIDSKVIKSVSKCKYLGLWIDSNLNLNIHINKTIQKLQQSLYHFHLLKHSGVSLYPKTIIQIYKTKTRPIIEYASIFFLHKDTIKSIQKMQNKFLRFAYPCKLSTPIITLQLLANLEPIQLRYKKLILRHWARSVYSSTTIH